MIRPFSMPTWDATVMNGKLRLLSLYGDLPASVRARWAAGLIARLAGPHWQITSEMWKIDSLQVSEPIREMITDDAANADVIIIAASSLTQHEPVLFQWLNSLEACQNHHPFTGLLVGLLGDDEGTRVDLGCVVKPLIHFAQQADRDFIWRWMEQSALNDSDWLTSCVNQLLARKLWFELFGWALRRLTPGGRSENGGSAQTPGQDRFPTLEARNS